MRSQLIAVMAGLAVAISLGALFASWEPGPTAKTAEAPIQEGRAALSTDPMYPAF